MLFAFSLSELRSEKAEFISCCCLFASSSFRFFIPAIPISLMSVVFCAYRSFSTRALAISGVSKSLSHVYCFIDSWSSEKNLPRLSLFGNCFKKYCDLTNFREYFGISFTSSPRKRCLYFTSYKGLNCICCSSKKSSILGLNINPPPVSYFLTKHNGISRQWPSLRNRTRWVFRMATPFSILVSDLHHRRYHIPYLLRREECDSVLPHVHFFKRIQLRIVGRIHIAGEAAFKLKYFRHI